MARIARLTVLLMLTSVALSAAPPTQPSTKPAKSRPGGEIVPPARRDVPGRRGKVSLGTVYVPDFFDASAGAGTDVVVWFLGASWCVEQAFYDARRSAVLVTVNGKDLAGAMRDPGAFPALLRETQAWLADAGITRKPIERVCVGSFSGGYVAVREILRQPESLKHVTDVVLADSLYAPRDGDKLDDVAMKPFLDYAGRAAKGECTFIFSHLYPPEERYRGNTTTLAASYLIDHLELKRETASGGNSRGAKLLYRADANGCHLLGYAGMTNQDHFDHLYGAGDLLQMLWRGNASNPALP